MFVRTARSGRNTYVQLAHNTWDPVRGRSTTKVVHSFGRAEELDVEAVRRLIGSLQRTIGERPAGQGGVGPVPEILASRTAGGALLLDGLWRQLGLDPLVTGSAQGGRGRKCDLAATERVFSLVANRALAPSSKLAAAEWMNHDVFIPRLAERVGTVTEDACYRAMDWLVAVEAKLAEQVYAQVTDLLKLEVDVLFFDTTSTYFETETADERVRRNERGQVATDEAGLAVAGDQAPPDGAVGSAGFRTWGKSKDSRDDLPQVIIGMAVTRDGIPVRVWSWPGNTADTTLIGQVRADMRDWSLSRIIYAADRGFASAANRRDLMAGGDGYILGEKLRSGSPETRAALSRPGRYQQVRDNLAIKEVNLRAITGTPERFIVCFNPDQAERDAHTRAALVTRLEAMIAGSDTLPVTRRVELRGRISTMPGLNRFLRVTGSGLLRIDKAKIDAETNLDGKYLLRTSDPKMSAEDIALGYKQLLQVERGWRDMKSTLDLRPVFHRLEERIRAHVVLCWLALLLIRIAENRTGATWATINHETSRLHALTAATPDGTFTTATKPSSAVTEIFTATGLPAPTQLLGIAPATPAAV
jgi:IS4 transposase